MRMVAAACFCALFVAGMWAFPSFSWADGSKSAEGLAWHRQLPPGKILSVKNLNGPVTVTSGSGEAEIRADVLFKHSNPKDIRFEVKEDERGVTVCALWPGMEHCDGRGSNVQVDDLEVVFQVRVPPGAKADIVTVNGGIDARGTSSDLNVATVNGDVHVESRGTPLRVETVNGKIDVRLVGADGDGSIKLATVNGDISAQVPQGFDAEVTARTVSGSISIFGKEYQERVRTTVGRGGRKLSAQNVNGSIAIR